MSKMRKTYDLKQVKISTSILWLLNKAETRTVFFSSTDIFSNKTKLHLHSLIVRGLISGELYCAALTRLFSYSGSRPIRTKDFKSILDFVIGLDKNQLLEVEVLHQKNQDIFIENLMKLEPFELTEHLQVIDAIMALYLDSLDLIGSIPTILGKLCDYRPNVKDPKRLLEIWFKSITCLSLTNKNIKDTRELIKSLIIQENIETKEKLFVDSIKFSDKVALIMSFESDVLAIDKEFLFDYSDEGVTNRDNVKHNFITVIQVFRKYFSKVLEDFKELMLVLNSSHIQLSSNLLINTDIFILEFFTNLEEITNHGNRTFRMESGNSENKEINSSRTFRIQNQISTKDKLGMYHTSHKVPVQHGDKYSKLIAFGTYSGRKQDYQSSMIEEQFTNWNAQKTGNNLLSTARKSSVPNGLNFTGVNKNTSNFIGSDGTLKSKYFDRKNALEKKNDPNQTSWLIQKEKQEKNTDLYLHEGLSDQENLGQKYRMNETRLRLNLKRQEIEENRRQLNEEQAKKHQELSDKVFKDVTMGISQTKEEESNSHRPRRISDMKRGRGTQNKPDLLRSRSQDLSKTTVDDINISLNLLKSEISKLTSEQAKLSAQIAESKVDNLEAFSQPFGGRSMIPIEDSFDDKTTGKSSIKSMPISWHPYNNYGNTDTYDNLGSGYSSRYHYQMESHHPLLYSPYNSHPTYPYNYPFEGLPYQIPVTENSINRPYMSKSVRENINSRPTSPGAVSGPSEAMKVFEEPESYEVKESEPLTVQNLMKHNKSMEQLPRDSYYESNSQKSNVRNSTEQKMINSINGSLAEFGNKNPKSKNSVIHDQQPAVDFVDSTNHADNSVSTRLNNESTNLNNDDKTSPDKSKLFFVSFDDENKNKKLSLKPKLREPNGVNGKILNSSKKSNENTLNNTESANREIVRVEKPVAFVIGVDDEPKAENKDNSSANKIFILNAKREQERKEKLEKIRETARIENEMRIQKEFEKEKIKEEKKLKRDAIFEAFLVKKSEKEANEGQSRKEVKNRKPNRATSALPPVFRNEFQNDANSFDRISIPDTHPPDLLNHNSRREKMPTNVQGPKLFVEPKVKSNKSVILNAIKYCCLAGKVNELLKQQTIEDLERFEAPHFMILMRGGCQYRSLYKFEFESESLLKLSGIGPKRITNKMVEKFFKYNSGAKKFMEITSTNHLSTVIDGITIFNTVWKPNNNLSTQLNNSETSSQTEHVSQ